MKKLDPSSKDLVAENISTLKQLFPSIVADGKVDFDVLRQLLGDEVDGAEERYGLHWHGKAQSRQLALTPSTGTLLPVKEESVDWETTQNLIIEGDNLEVLKLLQKSYAGKVKLIYIDPPYNTGKDFVFPDNYRDNVANYLEVTKQLDEDGAAKFSNSETTGRLHTNWLNMIYPRLLLSRELLTEDGLLLVSIDEREEHTVRSVCEELFGPGSVLAQLVWRTDGNFDNQSRFKVIHEYVLVVARNPFKAEMPPAIDPGTPANSKLHNKTIANTIIKNGPKNPEVRIVLPSGFPANFETGTCDVPSNGWPKYNKLPLVDSYHTVHAVTASSGWSSASLLQRFIENQCEPIADQKGRRTVFYVTKGGAIEAEKHRGDSSSHVVSIIGGVGGPQTATKELALLDLQFEGYPKPTTLIEYLIQFIADKDCVVLDFFAGSGTTGHAVLKQNTNDGGDRRFILVQFPEPIKKADYPTIADITKERMRRAADQIREESGDDAPKDMGFRVFKLERSNLIPWNPNPPADQLDLLVEQAVDNIRGDRTDDDVLYEILLKLGLDLAAPLETKTVANFTVHSVGSGQLLVCLGKEIKGSEASTLAHGIAAWYHELTPESARQEQPTVLFRDNGFQTDEAKQNVVATLAQRGLTRVRSV